jgi:hypothetical protein
MNIIKYRYFNALTACGVLLASISTGSPSAVAEGDTTPPVDTRLTQATGAAPAGMTMATFLDRLMMSESGGRDTVANPRSSAVGAFQFITATFLDVTRRHFAAETASLSPASVLALRTNRDFARRAAQAYTQDNANHLAAAGLPSTWPNLRLAFFAGPEGAVRTLKANPSAPVREVLGAAIVAANPFLATYTAGDLVARSARDLQVASTATGGLAADGRPAGKRSRAAQIPVLCDLGQASCRRWLALAQRRQIAKVATKVAAKVTVIKRPGLKGPTPAT